MSRRTAMAAVALAAMAAAPIPEVKASAVETSPAASGPPPKAPLISATELEATSTPDEVERLKSEISDLTRQLANERQRNAELTAMLEAQSKDHRAEVEQLRTDISEQRDVFNAAWEKREREIEARFNAAWEKREGEIKARFDVMRDSAASLTVPSERETVGPRRYRARGKLVLVHDGKRVNIIHEGEIPADYDVSTLPPGSYEVIR